VVPRKTSSSSTAALWHAPSTVARGAVMRSKSGLKVKGAGTGRGEAGLGVACQGEAGGCLTQETPNRSPQGQRCWRRWR
jgi:hypothetical protein